MDARVALVRCDSYEQAVVDDAVRRGLVLLGGAERFVTSGESIVVKPNLLVASSPDAAVTTHPAVFEAVALALAEAGASLTYGDSPGFGNPEAAARRAGIAAVADRLGVPCADFTNGTQVSAPEGRLIKQWFIANGVLEAHGIVSLPKLKTHALTRMTGAVKNQFGCIPGARKGEFHARMPDVERFCQMLVDLALFLRPRLHVMDAVVAMEGNGPRGGDPRQVGALLLSADPVALDATACRLIDLDPALVGTVTSGGESGLGVWLAEEIELVGDALDSFAVRDFVANRSGGSTTGRGVGGPLGRRIRSLIVPRPVIVEERCTRCGTCVEVCPVEPNAVDWVAGEDATGRERHVPVYDYAQCIRCYCCQEMCPERAIEVDIPLLGRFVHRAP